MHDLNADILEEEAENAQVPLAVGSEQIRLRPVVAPRSVRWREFRIQVLPVLAFSGALILAGVLWKTAVMPIPADRSGDLLPGSTESHQVDPGNLALPLQAFPHSGTNGIAKAPSERD